MKLNLNVIIRQDINEKLQIGNEYPFSKDSLCVLADEMAIWLADKNWNAIAEIMVTSQQRKSGTTSGTFKVLYLYQKEEQEHLTKIFRRMYS